MLVSSKAPLSRGRYEQSLEGRVGVNPTDKMGAGILGREKSTRPHVQAREDMFMELPSIS